MSFKKFISDFYRSLVGTFSQFGTDDKIISDETKEILADENSRKDLFQKINEAKKNGEQNIKFTHNNKTIEYSIEH